MMILKFIKTMQQLSWLTAVRANRCGLRRLGSPTVMGHDDMPTANGRLAA